MLDHGEGDPIRAVLIDVRSALTKSLSGVLPDPEATLASGILFGARADIPADLTEDMQATGTSHLVAVSGQNVVLMAALLMGALAWIIGRRPAAWIALGGVIGYAMLVGGQPSVVRAAIMGGLYVVAIAIGRRNTALVTITFAAAIMTALDPQIVHDVSFQLSFSATLGLILLTPLMAGAFESLTSRSSAVAEFPLTRVAIDVATMTLAATAFTLPVLAISFHRVSLAAPLANLFAVPAFVAVAADIRSGGRRGFGLSRAMPPTSAGSPGRRRPTSSLSSVSSPICRSPRSSCVASTSSTPSLTTPCSESRSGRSPGVRSNASSRRPLRLLRESRVSSPRARSPSCWF